MDMKSNEVSFEEASLILSALPEPRKDTYLGLADSYTSTDDERLVLAARLYIWNGDLASAVDRSAGEVEIQLRNFMDKAFIKWNTADPRNGSAEWLLYPKDELEEITKYGDGKTLVDNADVKTAGNNVTHDDYIAGLTFGQWVHLLPKPHATDTNARVILWKQALEPCLSKENPGVTNRVIFQQQAMSVKEIRNRATHRRPLIKNVNAVNDAHRDCIELLRAINPELGEWFKGRRWIPEVLSASPLQ